MADAAPGRAVIYPGPASILPGMAPGGVVIHGYSVPGERLLFVQAIPADGSVDVSDAALRGAEQALCDPEPGTCLVAYDGDTGARFGADDWVDDIG